MFERFADRARRVVVLAQDEAQELGHNYIGTEHMLLALIREGEGVAALVLADLGIEHEAVCAQVAEIIGVGQQREDQPSHIPFTPRVRKVLELTLREALQLGHSYVGTEHILLALVHEGQGVASQVLVKLGFELPRIRQAVTDKLGSFSGAAVRPASTMATGSVSTIRVNVPPSPTGVWVAFNHDGSAAVPFATEVEALRYALGLGMAVEFTKFGEAVGRPGSAA